MATDSIGKVKVKKKTFKIRLFILYLLTFIFLFIFLTVVNVFGPILWNEIKYAYNNLFNEEYKRRIEALSNIPRKVNKDEILLEPINQVPNPIDRNFSIIIPKIDVNQKVIPNVDINNPEEVESVLKIGVGWAKGTAEPGSVGNSLLFSHSAASAWGIRAYNAQFTLLDKLQEGDLFTIFYKDRQFDFMVFNKQIVSPDDRSYITAIAEGRIVTLQTCHPPGLDTSRLLVRGRLIAVQAS